MAKRTINRKNTLELDGLPFLKTVEQMSKVSGIGENRLRILMDKGELEYVQNGNRRLIADEAIFDWYRRVKRSCKAACNE